MVQVEALQREIELLKDLDHDNIIRYFGTSQTADKLLIFLEYASSGSVSSLLAKYVLGVWCAGVHVTAGPFLVVLYVVRPGLR